ncbi:NAD(P)-binding domain, partial [Trinorchestia longiramus]
QRNEKGSFVNISSIAAERMFPGRSTYTATKAAVCAYTKIMAVELSPKGIRVNAISPSHMKTPMTFPTVPGNENLVPKLLERTPLHKIAELDDVANAIIFLLSDKSNMITGHVLPVEGGYFCT